MRADKRLIVRALAKKTGLPQRVVEPLVAAAGEVVAEIAAERGECRWPGFGRFRRSAIWGTFTVPCGEDSRDVMVDTHTLRYKPYLAVRIALTRRRREDGKGEAV